MPSTCKRLTSEVFSWIRWWYTLNEWKDDVPLLRHFAFAIRFDPFNPNAATFGNSMKFLAMKNWLLNEDLNVDDFSDTNAETTSWSFNQTNRWTCVVTSGESPVSQNCLETRWLPLDSIAPRPERKGKLDATWRVPKRPRHSHFWHISGNATQQRWRMLPQLPHS